MLAEAIRTCTTLTTLNLSDNQDENDVKLIGRAGMDKLIEVMPHSNLINVLIDPHPSAQQQQEQQEQQDEDGSAASGGKAGGAAGPSQKQKNKKRNSKKNAAPRRRPSPVERLNEALQDNRSRKTIDNALRKLRTGAKHLNLINAGCVGDAGTQRLAAALMRDGAAASAAQLRLKSMEI